MKKISEYAQDLAAVYTEGASVEELLARMEVLNQEVEYEDEEPEAFEYSSGHIDTAIIENQNRYFEELCLEVKKEYGTDLKQAFREV